jgi:hypothetical protein
MPFNAKIDLYFSDKGTLTESELKGFNLFAGKPNALPAILFPFTMALFHHGSIILNLK